MSTRPTKPESWHQCRKCGEVYLAVTSKTICPACGAPQESEREPQKHQIVSTNVVGKKASVGDKPEFLPNRKVDTYETQAPLPQVDSDNQQATPQKNHKPHISEQKRATRKLLTIISVWLVVLLVVCYLLIHSNDKFQNNFRVEKEKQADLNYYQDGIDANVWNRAKDKISPLASEFFSSSSPHVLAQVCRIRPRIIQTIAADTVKIITYPVDATPVFVQSSIAWCGDKSFIETLWKDNRDRLIELVFAEDDGEWKIDWESYARSSTQPWSVFSNEEGDAVGTFRFLVRERTAADANDGMLNIAFHDPALYHGMEPIAQTTPFIIDRKSRNARLILAALQARNENNPILRSMYPEADMHNTARVHVRIRRTRADGKAEFTLEEVLACHWLGWDDPGVTLPDAP
jgi:predicted  nucleic acid-binding Zn-ribbon protein